jgi:hypothetical protein
MSTTFEVYPRTKALPSFSAIVDRSTEELHRFLDSVGILSSVVVPKISGATGDH